MSNQVYISPQTSKTDVHEMTDKIGKMRLKTDNQLLCSNN